MATSLPDGRRGQFLALGITVIVAAIVWIGAIAPALDWYSGRDEQLRRQLALSRRMAALVETLPALRREAEAPGTSAHAAPLLTGASDTVAAAVLQQRIDEMAAEAGVRVASEETLPAKPAGDLRAIAVRITVSGPWARFVALLLALGQAEIPMIADEIQVRSLSAAARTTDVPVDATLTITSFRIATDDSK